MTQDITYCIIMFLDDNEEFYNKIVNYIREGIVPYLLEGIAEHRNIVLYEDDNLPLKIPKKLHAKLIADEEIMNEYSAILSIQKGIIPDLTGMKNLTKEFIISALFLGNNRVDLLKNMRINEFLDDVNPMGPGIKNLFIYNELFSIPEINCALPHGNRLFDLCKKYPEHFIYLIPAFKQCICTTSLECMFFYYFYDVELSNNNLEEIIKQHIIIQPDITKNLDDEGLDMMIKFFEKLEIASDVLHNSFPKSIENNDVLITAIIQKETPNNQLLLAAYYKNDRILRNLLSKYPSIKIVYAPNYDVPISYDLLEEYGKDVIKK